MFFSQLIVEVTSCDLWCVKILAQKLGTIDRFDTNCPLCKEEFESGTYFFFNCAVARANWFALKSIPINNHVEIAELVLDAPDFVTSSSISSKLLQEQYSLQIALTLEAL